MAGDDSDSTIAAMSVGFTLGFGILTVWEAIKQTRRSKNPRRSAYIYMVWGELVANLGILILSYLVLYGVLDTNAYVLFFILFFWVFEIQLLMQIIINRIAIISGSQKTIRNLKWGTSLVISAINVAVFCIFIPAHMSPPVNDTYVNINRIWDRLSKVLICIVDAGLNWYFLRIVKARLVDQYGLMKYEPLVKFNARLMVVSVLLDVLLIGLMSLPNQIVFMLFHPLVYTAKLNIEMTMASLIVRLARNGRSDAYFPDSTSHNTPHRNRQSHAPGHHDAAGNAAHEERDVGLKTFTESTIRFDDDQAAGQPRVPDGGIQRTREFRVTVHQHQHKGSGGAVDDSDVVDHMQKLEGGCCGASADSDDEAWLTHHAGHPIGTAHGGQDGHSATSRNTHD